jgi:hypothetical protein
VPHDENGVPHARNQLPNAVAHGGLVATPSDLARLAIEIGLAYQGRLNRLLSKRSAEMLEVLASITHQYHWPDLANR